MEAERDQADERHQGGAAAPGDGRGDPGPSADGQATARPSAFDRSGRAGGGCTWCSRSRNLVAGANRPDYHFRNVNYGRDYTADMPVTDIVAAALRGMPACTGGALRGRGVEVGNIFKLGTKYSATKRRPIWTRKGVSAPNSPMKGRMASARDGLLASVIEHHHDELGHQWSITIAPYTVLLSRAWRRCTLEVASVERTYAELTQAIGGAVRRRPQRCAASAQRRADLLGIRIRLKKRAGQAVWNRRRSEMNLQRRVGRIPRARLADEVQGIIDAEEPR